MSASRRFQFIKLIASGGFGDVYLCKEFNPMGVSRLVAMKLLKSRWSENEEIVKRIRDEARLLALLRHHNIINVYDMTSIHGRTAVVMEYLEAIDLAQIISQMKEMKRRVPLKVCLEMVACVASALDAAYNQPPFPGEKPLRVIHRDIKPSNIMLDADGIVKVLDFGVAHSNFDGRESETRELQFGSIGYMAPERLFSEPESSASDVYSLGSTLFEAISSIAFGKAHATNEKHTEFVHKRINQLLSVLRLDEALKKQLFDLLAEALAFEAMERISANKLADRARHLSKLLKGPDLEMWAQKAVVHLRNTFAAPPEGSLNGEVITEDPVAVDLNRSMSKRKEAATDLETHMRDQVRADMKSAAENQTSTTIRQKEASKPPMVSSASSGTGIYQSLSKTLDQPDLEPLAAASPLIDESTPLPAIDPSSSEMISISSLSPVENRDSTASSVAEPPPPPPLPNPAVIHKSQVNEHIPLPPDIEADTAEITHFDTSVPGLSHEDVSESDHASLSLSEPEMEINPKPMTIPPSNPNVRRRQPIHRVLAIGLMIIGVAVVAYIAFAFFGGEDSGKTMVQTAEIQTENPQAESQTSPTAIDKTTKQSKKLYQPEAGEKVITIVSKVADTKWIKIDCGNKRFKGVDKVISPLKNSKECAVNAKFKSAGTKMVQIRKPKPGVYNCFSKRDEEIVETCKLQ